MKKSILTVLAILSIHASIAQTKSETVARWSAGAKELTKMTTGKDSICSYIFLFRNVKYQQIVDYKSVTIGDLNELKTFVETVDSLLTHVKLKKGESLNYSIGNVKNINLSLFLGKTAISVWDNSMLGYCYIGAPDLKKMRTAYTEK